MSGKFEADGTEYNPPLSRVEKWYNTSYEIQDIAEEFLQELVNVEENEELHLPIPHDFVPQDFEMIPVDEDMPPHPVSF